MRPSRNAGIKLISLLLTLVVMLPSVCCTKKAPESKAVMGNAPVADSSAPETPIMTVVTNSPDAKVQKENAEEDSKSSGLTDAVSSLSPSQAPTPLSTSAIEATEVPELEDTPSPMEIFSPENDGLTPTQRNSINMLNYMTALTQHVNENKGNQLYLELAYDSFDNLYPNSVDTKTQAQITSLMDTIQGYRMISVKRARLEFIFEQNRAQAMRQAIPNPIVLLSTVQSGNILKAAASILYMAVDSSSSYKAATSQADLQFIKDGWELDDAETAELHNSTKNALTYLLNMVRDYDLPGDYALNREAVENFVLWSSKPDSQLVAKIAWLESHQNTYSAFGPYWLELAQDYYKTEDYENCLNAVKRYESVSTRIFRKDIDYATVLPLAIISAKEVLSQEKYVEEADRYCLKVIENTKDENWSLRYFIAQIYLDIYSITKNTSYVDVAYKLAFDNTVVLVDGQRDLNKAYLGDLVKVEAKKEATKREKQEAKSYNKAMEAERKIALPPVSEPLYLNCELLFALAKEKKISAAEQKRIEAILHENGEAIFLTQALDNRFWFTNKPSVIKAEEISVTFDGEELTIPASCITDRSKIIVTVTGKNGTTFLDDWTVNNVKRPKNVKECSGFIVTFTSKEGKTYKYQADDVIKIMVVPVAETPNENIVFTYNVVAIKRAFVINGIDFQRVTE